MPRLSDMRFTFAPIAASANFEVIEFTLDEALSSTYQLRVALSSFDPAVDFGALLDQPALFTIWRGDTPVRHVHGIVTGFEQGDTGFRRTRYRAVVEPALARTALCSDWRIFQQQSVPEILEQILKSHGITDYEQIATNEHLAREYCVQAGDTDLQFLDRLAAEEGLFYRFVHSDHGHRLIHGDRIYVHGTIDGGPVAYNPTPGGDQPEPALHRFTYAEHVRTARQTQRDSTRIRSTTRNILRSRATCPITRPATNATTIPAATSATKPASPSPKAACWACAAMRAWPRSRATTRGSCPASRST